MTCDRCGSSIIGGWYRHDGSVVCLRCIEDAHAVATATTLGELFAAMDGPVWPDDADAPVVHSVAELMRRIGWAR